MSASAAVQAAIFDKLRADSSVRSLTAGHLYDGSPTGAAVYDHAPQVTASESTAAFPYIVIGDDTSIAFDTDDVDGQEHTVVLHVWDRRRGKKRVKQLQDAVYNCLHDAALSVSSHSTVYCFFEFAESVPDPDVLIQHGVIRFRIVTQQS